MAEGQRPLPLIVLTLLVAAQFAGTCPWFAGNAVLPELERDLEIVGSVAFTTSAVQFGFICGTLLLAISGLTDRWSASHVFAGSALGAAATNLGLLWAYDGTSLALWRFGTGLFLAGVYPVGMKLAASHADPEKGGLGAALGFLVGALVLGTAFPHGLRALGEVLPWRVTILVTSGLAAVAGIGLYLTVSDGPYLSSGQPRALKPGAVFTAFRDPPFRAAALGYFGHMWELYTVWALVPAILLAHDPELNPSPGAFAMIAAGAVGCAVGGLVASRLGSRRVAWLNLVSSAALCATAPLWWQLPTPIVFVLLLTWGFVVVGDSPQLSALTAQTAPRELVGSALTMVTCIGFALTIVSLAVTSLLPFEWAFPVLALGPLLGAWVLRGEAQPA
ncbi:MAG: MFS transporter [Myxococcota bacterium]